MAGVIGTVLRNARQRSGHSTTDEEGETMAKAKVEGKPKTQKRLPFGGYAVNFKGCTDTLESLFGSAPIPPSGMTKRLWDYVKRHRLATKG